MAILLELQTTRFFTHLFYSSLKSALKAGFKLLSNANHKTFVEALYQDLLEREADEGGLNHYLDRAQYSSSKWRWGAKVFKDLALSGEYWCRISRNICLIDSNEAHHLARKRWVKKHIPAAKHILDLGGSSSYDIDGSLLALGYPYQAQTITIIDFPPSNRQVSSYSELSEPDHIAKNGSKIKFIYDSFLHLDRFEDNAFDLLIGGQIIEHVTEDEGRLLFRNAFRVLEPGGHFCLDTPNRRITRMIAGGNVIHPEHKLEYEVEQLKNIATSEGFVVVDEGAISPMPLSLRKSRFLPHEICANVCLSPVAELGFSFFISLQKPKS